MKNDLLLFGLISSLFGHVCCFAGVDKTIELKIRVLSEEQPVENAEVRGGFKRRFGASDPIIQYVMTDTNGVAEMSAITSGQVGVKVTKDGFYKHYENLDLEDLLREGLISRNRTIGIKKVRNPIPMYAKEVRVYMPDTNKKIGYDVTCGDWVEPWGNGRKTDFEFEIKHDHTDDLNYEVRLFVSFPNPNDGIQPFESIYPKHEGSVLISAHEAPLEGYSTNLTLLRICKNGHVSTSELSGGYYFRLNTVLNEDGHVISAQYGKIYGDVVFDRFNGLLFNYYYNPDKTRNVEFDPKQNLFLKGHKGRVPTCYSIGNP